MGSAHSRVAVVILTFNQKEKTLACLSSVYGMEGPAFDVLVWDNGSDDASVEAVTEAYPDAHAHRHGSNLGVAGGRNAAAAMAIELFSPEYLLFLDNDIIVTSGFLQALLEPFGSDAIVGQTQAKLLFLGDRERINDGGGCRISFWRGQTIPVGFGELDRGQRDQVRPCIACGGAMMTRRGLFESLGGFDSLFGPVGPEDLDYSLRLRNAGYRALYVPTAVAYHEVSHTFGGGEYTEAYARHKTRNWINFLRRHAPAHEKLVFFAVTAPFLALRIAVREGRSGNFGAIRGVVSGALELLRARGRDGEDQG